MTETKELQTITGSDIPINTRGILYLCFYDRDKETIQVVKEMFFETPTSAMMAYANIPNPESQVVIGETYDKLISDLHKLHERMQDKEWLYELKNYL